MLIRPPQHSKYQSHELSEVWNHTPFSKCVDFLSAKMDNLILSPIISHLPTLLTSRFICTFLGSCSQLIFLLSGTSRFGYLHCSIIYINCKKKRPNSDPHGIHFIPCQPEKRPIYAFSVQVLYMPIYYFLHHTIIFSAIGFHSAPWHIPSDVSVCSTIFGPLYQWQVIYSKSN